MWWLLGTQNIEKQMVNGFEYRYDTVRSALVSFSDYAEVRFHLNTYQERKDVLNALSFAEVGGRTNTQDALRMVHEDVHRGDRGDREGVTNLLFLITDGGSNVSSDYTVIRSRDLKNAGTRIHVIAIGSKVDMDEIDQVASGSNEPYVMRLTHQNEVASAANRLLDSVCT